MQIKQFMVTTALTGIPEGTDHCVALRHFGRVSQCAGDAPMGAGIGGTTGFIESLLG
ncbi:hypothetical protein HLB23_11475 [Nocardia uniformis]|uniref:Uncharacterized protein n=1 Tax=Nocardia uniformis TaxID=53432 RepID=A0A849C2D0_9NOCA|nr:hypothetical protein [Nocardia uniformis]NNH70475.1 hypothetical protein [Nocardia uniformis]